jgi:imidazoleglycerol-phosphate dehydratase|tara:strand:+ start:4296 stop:4871 length:576 start_codon:yes stop_codon:yes gene_type:complete
LRSSKTKRKTLETSIKIKVVIDGEGICEVDTGIRYLNHMINTLSKHSLIDLKIKAKGDLQHHIVEDVALALGDTISKALDKRERINRFGNAIVPMDGSLASVSLDLVKRPYSRIYLNIEHEIVEDMVREDIQHFLQSFIQSLEATVHINVEYGEDDHHKVEAAFKALALSLRQAVMLDIRRKASPSAKGVM